MRITQISSVVCNAAMRNWAFVRVETDDGKRFEFLMRDENGTFLAHYKEAIKFCGYGAKGLSSLIRAEAAEFGRIHGLADDNVLVANSLQLSSALLEAGRPHSVLPLSGVTHFTPQEVVAENLMRLEVDLPRVDRAIQAELMNR